MREIKFRAWEPNNEEMIYFDNLQAATDVTIAEHLLLLIANKHPFGNGLLQQYTGLKDKNGKEIYEGDVVEADHNDLGLLKFPVGPSICTDCLESDGFNPHSMEVIGNIYENKDLLEGEE